MLGLPVGPLTITNNGGEIRLKLRVSATPAQPIVVLGYPPISAGAMIPAVSEFDPAGQRFCSL